METASSVLVCGTCLLRAALFKSEVVLMYSLLPALSALRLLHD